MLDSRVSTYAADRIDGALDVVDKYVDKYLPPNAQDQVDCKLEFELEPKWNHNFIGLFSTV